MPVNVEAAARFLAVAERNLASVKGLFDEFVNLGTVVSDEAVRLTRSRTLVTQAHDGARLALAAVDAATIATTGAQQADSALAAIQSARMGVQKLVGNAAMLRDELSGGTIPAISAPQLAAKLQEVRNGVSAARTAIRSLPNAGEPVTSEVIAEIGNAAKTARAANAGWSVTHLDEVVTLTQKLDDVSGNGFATLDRLGGEMVTLARQGKYAPVLGSESELDQIITVLLQQRSPNPVIIGDPGQGRSGFVEALAKRIADGNVPPELSGARIWRISSGDVIQAAGAEQGSLETLLKNMITEVKDARSGQGGQALVFFDDLSELLKVPGASQYMRPALERGELVTISKMTRQQFTETILKDASLSRSFVAVTLKDLSNGQVLDALRKATPALQQHHDILVVESARIAAAKLSGQYVRTQKQPAAALDLLDYAMSMVSNAWRSKAPARYTDLADRVKTLQTTITELAVQADVFGDTQAAQSLSKAQAELAEAQPRLTAMAAQLADERATLQGYDDAVRGFMAARAHGGDTSALMSAVKDGEDAVRSLRATYADTDRLLTNIVDETAVREAAAKLYNRPNIASAVDEARQALQLEDDLKSMVIGQDHAVSIMAKSAIRRQGVLRDPNKPVGVYIFLGPTGVGKTELAKGMAKLTTGDEKNIIRIDMGEYKDPQSATRIFGAPPSYVGYDQKSPLEELLERPDAIVLFDEVEKAHPEFWQRMLAFTDEGRLTTGKATTIDGRGATIIMSSNAPLSTLKSRFSPEFLNRVDDVIEFNALTQDDVGRILDEVQLPSLLKRAKEHGLDIKLTDAARDRIVDLGYDAEYGLRPLKRTIETHVVNPGDRLLAQMRVAGVQPRPGELKEIVLDIGTNGSDFVMTSTADGISLQIPAVRQAGRFLPGAEDAARSGDIVLGSGGAAVVP